jgi:peptidoglycan/LPS O-acetylase OafA/YrhL
LFIVGNFRTLIVRAATLGRDTFIKSRIRNIDGLRGIAVLSVIFFHASFTGVGGGFIGVDIFFVISGYVITNSILTNKMGGEFTLIRFYESRIRRLFPSLAVVLLVTFGLCFFLTPSDFFRFFENSNGYDNGCIEYIFLEDH